MKKYLYLLLFFSIAISACNIINPKEQVPTFLHLEPFIFTNPDSAFTGSASHNIPTAWVYVDDQPVGTFDLPCTVPVMISKTGKLLIVPAVTNQGLKSYVFQYPFYQTDTTTIVYNPGKTQNYTPKTKYSNSLISSNFHMKINFEEGIQFHNLSGDTSLLLEKDPAKVIEGKYSGAIYLNQDHATSESISANYFDRQANQCYLEFDYKCEVPFAIGLQGVNADGTVYSEYLAGFNPKATANKVYVDLSTFMNTNPTFTKLYIIVRAALDDDGTGKYTSGSVLIDNIKVIAR